MDNHSNGVFHSLASEHANLEYVTDGRPKDEYWKKKEELSEKMRDIKERYLSTFDAKPISKP